MFMVICVLFALAVLNEMLGSAPGTPMPAPTAADVSIAAATSLLIVGVGWFFNARTALSRPGSDRSHVWLAVGAVCAGLAAGAHVAAGVVVQWSGPRIFG